MQIYEYNTYARVLAAPNLLNLSSQNSRLCELASAAWLPPRWHPPAGKSKPVKRYWHGESKDARLDGKLVLTCARLRECARFESLCSA
jgi:hypothetical protein